MKNRLAGDERLVASDRTARDHLNISGESMFGISYAALAAFQGRWVVSGASRRSMRWIIAR